VFICPFAHGVARAREAARASARRKQVDICARAKDPMKQAQTGTNDPCEQPAKVVY
jgi:hypothetical protein